MRGRARVLLLRSMAIASIAWTGCADLSGPTPATPDEVRTWPALVPNVPVALPGVTPPAVAAQVAELNAIVQRQAALTPADHELIAKWNTSVTTPWTRSALEQLDRHWILLPDVRHATPLQATRALALMHVAMYEAVVDAWRVKFGPYLAIEQRLPAPYLVNNRIRKLMDDGGVPSHPSVDAAAAAAAAAVLAYHFPHADTAELNAKAREAGDVRILAGVASRWDVARGTAIGLAAANRVIQYGRSDRTAQVWKGTIPAGHGMWKPTPPRMVEAPFDPLGGTYKTWVLPRGDVFRLPPPPAPGSAQFERDLLELVELGGKRTLFQADVARFWGTGPPPAQWTLLMEREIAGRHLSNPEAARAHALLSMAMFDAFVACWDTKFTYWLARPITMDHRVTTVFATPPFPAYPSGHSTLSGAAGEVFAALFPGAAGYYHEKAVEASLSRVLAGVHYRFDVVDGEAMGSKVGKAVVAFARANGLLRN